MNSAENRDEILKVSKIHRKHKKFPISISKLKLKKKNFNQKTLKYE